MACLGLCTGDIPSTDPTYTVISASNPDIADGIDDTEMDMYCPAPPTREDAIAIRECGIRSFTFHREYADLCYNDWSDWGTLELLESNDVLVRCWSGKVTKKDIEVKVNGEIFHP